MKLLVPRWRIGRLGLRLSDRVPINGGSDTDGEAGSRGDVDIVDAASDISEGTPSTESAREVSEAMDGDGSGVSKCRRGGDTMVVWMGRSTTGAGLLRAIGSTRSSNALTVRLNSLRRIT